jgi:exopolysaccharide biosynthesis polyprenyl glycosylphosphotransferase
VAKPADIAASAPSSADASAEIASHRTLHWRVGERRKLLVLGDVVATLLAVLAALRIWAFAAHEHFTEQYLVRQWHWFVILPALWLLLASVNDYYNLRITARLQSSLLCLARITLELLVIYVAIFFLSPPHSLPHLFVAYYAGLSLILISAWRSLRVLLSRVVGHRRRAVIVGAGSAVESMWHTMVEEAHAEYEVVGCISTLATWRPANPALKLLGGSNDLVSAVRTYGVSEVVVAYGDEAPPELFQQVISCYTGGIVVVPMPDLFEQITGRVPIEHVDERLWALVLPLEGYRLTFHLYLVVKRTIDILFALVGLAVFAILLPMLALLIKVDSRGPVFYAQERVGRGGRIFRVLKFRSMVVNAEKGTGPQWAQSRDPRVTRVGSLLRKTRLDEAPQLLNILKGDMSFVGPRPERPAFVDTLSREIPFYRSRLVIKPGLTGWAQVRYRYGNTTEDQLRKLQYDLYYIRHQSILLDLLIIGKTFGTVVSMKGQ